MTASEMLDLIAEPRIITRKSLSNTVLVPATGRDRGQTLQYLVRQPIITLPASARYLNRPLSLEYCSHRLGRSGNSCKD